MLRYTAESLFVSPAQTLVNTVNTVGVMGKGIALEFRRRYPRMFERYRDFCKDKSLTVGKLYLYKTPHKWVLNFPTKKHWRGASQIEWIERGLEHFAATYEGRGITSVAFPQLGCGNGGLPWDVVGPLMQRYLEPLPLPVYVHIRNNPPGFTPEHEKPDEVSDFSRPRVQIHFEQFMEDVFRLAGKEPPQLPVSPRSEGPVPLPDVEFRSAGVVQGDDLEYLWYRLSQRGAVSLAELPGSLADEAEHIAAALLELDYIRSMTFVSGDRQQLKVVPGLRLSPPPMVDDGPLFSNEVKMARATLQ